MKLERDREIEGTPHNLERGDTSDETFLRECVYSRVTHPKTRRNQ
jgi:hypothetical protein